MGSLRGDFADDPIGEFGPADPGMAHGIVGTDSKGGIEQQDALLCPVGQVAMVWDGHADIGVELFKDIDQGGRRGDAFRY